MNIIIGDSTKNYMKLLKIESFPFTENELKSKYRQQLHIHHEDKGGTKGKTQEIIEAYEFLKNMVVGNIDALNKQKKYKKGMFDLSDECSSCNGMGTKAVYFNEFSDCPHCNKKCTKCDNGKFKLKSGRIVDCLACNGTGIWTNKGMCFYCMGSGPRYTESSKSKNIQCSKCEGTGRVEVERFNPVIPKGAVLV